MEKKIPMRTCIACKANKPKKELIRVVKSGDQIQLDRTGKLNGRGAYICPSKECLAKAIKNKGLERSFKQSIPKDVYESLEKEMSQLDSN